MKKNLASMDHGGVDNDCNIDDDNDGGFSGGSSGDSKDGELINFYLFNIIILCNWCHCIFPIKVCIKSIK